MKFKSKADLVIKIKQVRLLLNGRYRDGSKASFASDFKFMRYACVLLAAVTLSNFEYQTRKIQDETYVSYYSLYKVAKFLGLDFERTKAAPYVYKELIHRGHARISIENNRTYVTFTSKGKRSCEEKLEELQFLNEHFNENPLEHQRYRDEQYTSLIKGEKSKRADSKTNIDKLIKKISTW
jgi:predicted transcriptional regulator